MACCLSNQGRFNVKTGAATCESTVSPIKTWPVKIENSRVFVALG